MSHESVGILKKIEFDIRPGLGCTTFKTSRKVFLDNPSVCVSFCLSVCLTLAFSANSYGRTGKPIEFKLWGHVQLYGALRRINFCADSSSRYKIIEKTDFGYGACEN